MKTNDSQTNFGWKLSVLTLLIALSFSVSAQTMPEAQTLPYSNDFSGLTGVAPVYPAGWQGWQIAASTPSSTGRITAPTSDRTISAGTAASSSSGVYDYNGKIGFLSVASADIALCLAVNTTGFSNVKVAFDVMTIRNLYNGTTENRVNGLVLQYRVGTTGDFTIISYGNEYRNGTTIQTSGTDGIDVVTGLNAMLPSACDNQPVVQIRWIYRNVSGTAGSRPGMAIDNVSVNQVNNNADLASLSVDKNADNQFVNLMMFAPGQIQYDYYLAKGSVIPQIAAETSSAQAAKAVTQATNLAGTDLEKTATVKVTAQDGVTEKTYSVKFIETNNVFLSGNPMEAGAGWAQESIFTQSGTANGNNMYEGLNTVRCLTAATSAFIRLPVANAIGQLSFYAKKIDANVVGNFKVSTSIDGGEWTEVQNIGDVNSLTYQEITVPVNKAGVDSVYVRVEITKNGDTYSSAGYYLDDFAYTAYTTPVVRSKGAVTSFGTSVGNTVRDTIQVGGANLTGDISLMLTGTGSVHYAIDKSSMVQAGGKVTYNDLVITYAPTAAGEHNATLTISSNGATDVVYQLSGSTISTNISNLSSKFNLYTQHGVLHIDNARGSEMSIYNVAGQLIDRKMIVGDHETVQLDKGVYLIKIDEWRGKIMLK
jgi:hypothetical protein